MYVPCCCCCCYSLCGRPPWSPVFPVWAGLPFRTLPVGFTLHRFWFHRRCPRMRSEAHTKCLCWIVPVSRATFSASCTIFGEIQRSHSPADDGRERARPSSQQIRQARADEFRVKSCVAPNRKCKTEMIMF